MSPLFILAIIVCCGLVGGVQCEQKNKNFLMVGGYRPNDIELLAQYVVSLRIRKVDRWLFGAGHFCGGTIIGSRLILTAAHCLTNEEGKEIAAKHIVVVAGTAARLTSTNSTVRYRVARTILHENYKSLINDIGLIILKGDIGLNAATGIAKLSISNVQEHSVCTTLGWGRIFENGPLANDIVYLDVFIFSKFTCKRLIPEFIGESMICALNNNQDPCQGDSGGPLFCANKVAGIVSFGHGCAKYLTPSAFTDVYHYSEWIQKNASCSVHSVYLPFITALLSIFSFLCSLHFDHSNFKG